MFVACSFAALIVEFLTFSSYLVYRQGKILQPNSFNFSEASARS
jgi:hypothetical protein